MSEVDQYKNKKVIWYIHPYSGGPGIGPSFRPYDFCKEFAKRDVYPTIISPDFHHLMYNQESRLKSQTIKGVNYHFIKSKKYTGNGLKRLMHMISFSLSLIFSDSLKQQSPPSTIIISSPHLFSFLGAYVLSKRYKAKLILEVRDLWPLSLTDIVGVSKLHPIVILFKAIEKFAYEKSDYIVTLLKNSKDYFSDFNNIILDKVHYIPNGSPLYSNLDSHPNFITDFIAQLKDKGKFIVGYTGAHGTPNALMQLLEAFVLIKKNREVYDKIHLVFIGDGNEKESLKKFAKTNQLDCITFFEPVDKKNIRSIIDLFDLCYISLSKSNIFKYGVSPNKMFEYMMASKPILSSIPFDYIIREACCGIVAECQNPIDLSDKLREIMSLDKKDLENFGNNGHRYLINNHNIQELSKEYSRLFE